MDEWKMVYQQLYHQKENVNLIDEYFQMIIVESAREAFGFKIFNDNSVNWVDNKIHRLLKRKKKMANKISRFITLTRN